MEDNKIYLLRIGNRETQSTEFIVNDIKLFKSFDDAVDYYNTVKKDAVTNIIGWSYEVNIDEIPSRTLSECLLRNFEYYTEHPEYLYEVEKQMQTLDISNLVYEDSVSDLIPANSLIITLKDLGQGKPVWVCDAVFPRQEGIFEGNILHPRLKYFSDLTSNLEVDGCRYYMVVESCKDAINKYGNCVLNNLDKADKLRFLSEYGNFTENDIEVIDFFDCYGEVIRCFEIGVVNVMDLFIVFDTIEEALTHNEESQDNFIEIEGKFYFYS